MNDHAHDLGRGLPATLIRQAALAHQDGNWEQAHHTAKLIAQHPADVHPATAGLFSGAPAVAFALHSADHRAYRPALARLDKWIADLVHARLAAAHRRIDTRQPPRMREYDLISGLTGLGAYLLHRATRPDLLHKILRYLIRLLRQPIIANGHRLPGWWTSDSPAGKTEADWPLGHGNLGMAHGIAGPTALFALSARAGHTAPGQHQALNDACDLLEVWARPLPAGGDAWPETLTPVAGQVYSELVAAAGPAAAPHEAYLAISLDLKAAKRLISQAGGGFPGAFTVMEQTTSAIAQAARSAGLMVTGWLTAREIAAVIRTAYDPRALSGLQQWSESGRAEADPAAARPVVQVEEYDRVATDSARHATYWVEDWPRTETGAGFLHGLMFTAGVRRSLSLIYVPQGLESAMRDVQRKKAAIISDAAERSRRGQVDSEADSVEYADVKTRERQLIAGHADVALTGLLTVSAETDALLDAACAQIETAAVTAQVDLRRLFYQQPDAFTLGALPLARTAL
ncbi:SCO6880 family protein [Streptomyces sp. CC224B]|uniref:SCO6880 family protein n=1 Tax=Streptomyces sp. CC224B TaxID=3044571 RepID=UPI0024A98F98|nr:SCO6880 family protein [Streptomyces sp. CC224B]